MSHPAATPQDVRDINGTTASDEVIQPYIDAAHVLVDRAATCANTTDEILTQADAWLACHLMGSTGAGGASVGGVSSEKIETQSITYNASAITEQGIRSTTYGQTADMLLNGCLSSMNKQKAGVCFTGGA